MVIIPEAPTFEHHGSARTDESTECAPPNGVYDFEYEFKSGNCSRVFPNALDSVVQTSYDRITFVGGMANAQSLCARESVMSTDGCVIEVDRTCNLPRVRSPRGRSRAGPVNQFARTVRRPKNCPPRAHELGAAAAVRVLGV
jgi:hypothetical protein